MVTKRIFIHGRVQGVFFRGWTVNAARALGVNGWVRNRTDGTVEALVSGPEEAVDALIARCRSGPPEARVDHVEVEETAEQAPAGFSQRPSV